MVCRNARCTFFFSLAIKIGSCPLSCDILGISLIYVSPTSEYGDGKPIKQFSQPIPPFFILAHIFFILKAMAKKEKSMKALSFPKWRKRL